MIRQRPFSITLTSNASMDRFPKNTTARFSNTLPERLVLQGEWEVCITKLRYPLRFYNISDSTCSVSGTVKDYIDNFPKPSIQPFCVYFSNAILKDSKALLQNINKSIRDGIRVSQFFYEKGGKVYVNQAAIEMEPQDTPTTPPVDNNLHVVESVTRHKVQPVTEPAVADEPPRDVSATADVSAPADVTPHAIPKPPKPPKITPHKRYVTSLVPSPMLARMLGYLPHTDVINKHKSTYMMDPFMGFPYEVFVYCNIVSPQLVGDSFVQVIDSTLIETEPEDSKRLSSERSFFPQNWVPLLRQDINVIHIDLRDGFGNLIPFADGFSSALVLSFRPKP